MNFNLDSIPTNELISLVSRCNEIIENRHRSARAAQKLRLMEQLQEALSDIKDADFKLTIYNTDNPNWILELMPEDIYSIDMTDVKNKR